MHVRNCDSCDVHVYVYTFSLYIVIPNDALKDWRKEERKRIGYFHGPRAVAKGIKVVFMHDNVVTR